MSLFTGWKSNKETGVANIIAQSTDEDLIKEVLNNNNDNTVFVKKANGSILGDKSNLEIFTKEEIVDAFNQLKNETLDLDNQD